jgi:hypothetical protein
MRFALFCRWGIATAERPDEKEQNYEGLHIRHSPAGEPCKRRQSTPAFRSPVTDKPSTSDGTLTGEEMQRLGGETDYRVSALRLYDKYDRDKRTIDSRRPSCKTTGCAWNSFRNRAGGSTP